MFGLLRNKLSSFIKGLAGKEEKKEAPKNEAPPAEVREAKKGLEAEKGQQLQLKDEKTATRQKANTPLSPKKDEETKPTRAKAELLRQETSKEAISALADKEKKVKQKTQAAEKPQKKPFEENITPNVLLPEEKPIPNLADEKRPERHGGAAEPARPKIQTATSPASAILSEVASKPEVANAHVPQMQNEQPKKSLVDSVVGVFSQKKTEGKEQQAPTGDHLPDQGKGSNQNKQSTQTLTDLSRLEKKAASERKGVAPKIGIGTAVKSFFSNEITIGESEVSDMLGELELSLLEADVAYEVSTEVTAQLRGRLIGMKVQKSDLEPEIKKTVQNVLESVMESDRRFDMVKRVCSLEKPARILFVGPNGAGKTTTMAKVARMLMDAGLTVVFSASDTFRAAAIEQTEVHAGKLGVRVVKSKYGADPASVAFDAINFARANSIDVVLIDSAGRQDTNANLLSELKKINRIAKPDLKIYIGESIGGNSVIEQIRAFNEAIGVDGAILTKLDCDAKGGTAISIAKSTGIPVIFLGIGQEYTDLVPFDAAKIAREIMT